MTESSLTTPSVSAEASSGSAAAASQSIRRYAPGLASVTFGMMVVLMTPVMVSMAFKVQHISATTEEATANLGLILGVGALFALVANPLAGRLSDRTTSRWGMRRPWIVGGAVVGLGASVLIGAASSVWVVLLAWCLLQAAMNAVIAAANATLPDQVAPAARGKVSGLVGIMTPLAILAGTALTNFIADDLARFVVPSVIGLVLAVAFALVLKDRRLEARPSQRLTLAQFFGSFVFNPVKHPDLGWTWLTKFLIMFGYAGVATFLPFYLVDKFGLDEQAAISTILMANLAGMAAMVISSPLGGMLSDRTGKRRMFVTAAGLIMVVGLVILAFAPTVGSLIVAQAVIGFGAGSFFSVDLALATEVLPNPEDTAKDLGVLNMANALPQSIAPAIAPAVIAFGATTALGGYTTWYLFGALIACAGAVLVYRIKGVS